MYFIKIQTGKLNTLVNKFMAVSRLCGILYIGVISFDQMVKAIFDDNEVKELSNKLSFHQNINVMLLAKTKILLLLLPVISNVFCVRQNKQTN